MAGGMTPRDDELVGGVALRRAAIQSPNYAAGSSGWTINQDGTCEFNSGTFRGSIVVGTAGSNQIIINNPATGDVFDVYNNGGQLIADVNAAGWFQSYAIGFPNILQHVTMEGDGLHYTSDNDGSFASVLYHDSKAIVSGIPSLQFFVQNSNGTSNYTLAIAAKAANGSGVAGLLGTERGVPGSFLQSDQSGVNNLIHFAAISGTTDGSGFLTFSHGASFKDSSGNPVAPSYIFVQVHDTGTPTFGDVDVIDGSITTGQAKVFCAQFSGAARTNAAVNFWIMCVG